MLVPILKEMPSYEFLVPFHNLCEELEHVTGYVYKTKTYYKREQKTWLYKAQIMKLTGKSGE